MPLTIKTSSSARKAGLENGSHRLLAWFGSAASKPGAVWGGRARDQASQASTSASTKIAAVAGSPRTLGVIEARITPASPRPSRQATMRLRCTSSPPSMAPQDWCITLKALKAA